MTGAIVAAFIAAGALNGSAATLALCGAICLSAMVAITLAGNMPINLRVFRWDKRSGDPEEWRRLRRRWDHLHSVRIVLDLAGFVLVALAAVQA